MPDTLTATTVFRGHPRLSPAEIIRLERMPLPSHAIEGGNFRRWAVAVCNAEVKHRAADFQRAADTHGLLFDRYAEPDCEQIGQFPHEAFAGAALLWLSHLQAHESERRAPWDCLPWDMWTAKRRGEWLARRRVLWAGFVKAVRGYVAARADLAAAAMKEAA